MPSTAVRSDFIQLVDLRLDEAKILLDHGKWDGAYYLAGYVVELALKVRIIGELLKIRSLPRKKTCGSILPP